MILFNEFTEGRSKESENFRFRLQCLKILQILLNFIRADRECNWDLHISSLVAMLPYFFVCDKPNYSRWGTLYASDMLIKLPVEVRDEFL